MKCNEIRELLSLYIDNMLDENQVREVEEHLSTCAACRKEYNELKEMLELLGETEMLPVPDEFSFRLKKALKEEKQSMIAEGLIAGPPKKKSQWRIITSIAAIFAVGLISFSIYDNILGSIPFFNNGTDQAGPAAKAEEIYEAETDDSAAKAVIDEESAEDTASSSDGTVVMKDQLNEMQTMMSDEAEAAGNQNTNNIDLDIQKEAAGNEAQTYGAAVGSEPNEGDRSADAGSTPSAGGSSEDFAFKGNAAPSAEDCSRSLTGSGLERNSAAVQFYNKQIEEKLSGFDYQILETTYAQTGEWQFRIFIFRGKDGNTYNEEIRIIGKDGKIETICSNDFMGL